MKRTILLLAVLAFFVACGGGDDAAALIANTEARTPRFTLDTFASSGAPE